MQDRVEGADLLEAAELRGDDSDAELDDSDADSELELASSAAESEADSADESDANSDAVSEPTDAAAADGVLHADLEVAAAAASDRDESDAPESDQDESDAAESDQRESDAAESDDAEGPQPSASASGEAELQQDLEAGLEQSESSDPEHESTLEAAADTAVTSGNSSAGEAEDKDVQLSSDRGEPTHV